MDGIDLAARIGRRIRVLRELRGLTQEQLAYAGPPVGSKGYLSDIEAGKRLPSLTALAALAERLDVSIADLTIDPDHDERDRIYDVARGAPTSALGEALAVLRSGLEARSHG